MLPRTTQPSHSAALGRESQIEPWLAPGQHPACRRKEIARAAPAFRGAMAVKRLPIRQEAALEHKGWVRRPAKIPNREIRAKTVSAQRPIRGGWLVGNSSRDMRPQSPCLRQRYPVNGGRYPRGCGARSNIPSVLRAAACGSLYVRRGGFRGTTVGNKRLRRDSRRDSRCSRGHRPGSNDARKPRSILKTTARRPRNRNLRNATCCSSLRESSSTVRSLTNTRADRVQFVAAKAASGCST